MSDEDARHSRWIETYSNTLSLVGVISTGGLAATATIVQLAGRSTIILNWSAGLFILSLVSSLFSMTCLTGQAKNKIPKIDSPKLSWSAFFSIIFLGFGGLSLFIGILNSNNMLKSSKDSNSCVCNSPMYYCPMLYGTHSIEKSCRIEP